MADINIGALRKFQDMWVPVMESIPAVLEMVEKRADMDRAMAAYAADVEKARKAAEREKESLTLTVDSLRKDIVEMSGQKADWVKELAEFKKDALAERKAIETKHAQAAIAAEMKTAAALAALADADAAAARKQVETQSAHDALVAIHAAEIKDLETRKDKAEKALDALRAKLG